MPVATSGGELSFAGVLAGWLSFAGASMMTVLVDVEVGFREEIKATYFPSR